MLCRRRLYTVALRAHTVQFAILQTNVTFGISKVSLFAQGVILNISHLQCV